MVIPKIPTIDFSVFLNEGHRGDDKKKLVIDEVGQACSEYGFFQVVNHGVPLDLLNNTLHIFKTFFDYSTEEKLKCIPVSTAFPCGYGKMDSFVGNNEWFMMFQPGSSCNVFSANPPQFRETLEEYFKQFQKLGSIVESIINECLGLPIDFLKQYNDDRSVDAMIAWHYPPTTDKKKIGREAHQDTSCITFVLQDEVEGLEVENHGTWIPIPPVKGALVVNVGVNIQVLSNKKYTAAQHRVLKNEGSNRYSIAFSYNFGGDKWVEPLPQLTKEIGEVPKYRGFYYKEYLQARMKKERSPPTRPEDVINIDHYAVLGLFLSIERSKLSFFIQIYTCALVCVTYISK